MFDIPFGILQPICLPHLELNISSFIILGTMFVNYLYFMLRRLSQESFLMNVYLFIVNILMQTMNMRDRTILCFKLHVIYILFLLQVHYHYHHYSEHYLIKFWQYGPIQYCVACGAAITIIWQILHPQRHHMPHISPLWATYGISAALPY